MPCARRADRASTVQLQAALAAQNARQVSSKIKLARLDALSAMLAHLVPQQAPHRAMLVLLGAMPTLLAPLRALRATVCVPQANSTLAVA